MGLLEVILIAAAAAILRLVVASVRGHLAPPPRDVLEDVLGSAHDRVDEIELARVRSMLQRR